MKLSETKKGDIVRVDNRRVKYEVLGHIDGFMVSMKPLTSKWNGKPKAFHADFCCTSFEPTFKDQQNSDKIQNLKRPL